MIRPDEIFDNGDDSEDYMEEQPVDFYDGGPNQVILEEADGLDDFEFHDEGLNDIDFSEFKGGFESSLKQLNGKLKKSKANIKKVAVHKPLSKRIGVTGSATLLGKIGQKGTRHTTQRIDVPNNRKVIVKTVDDFMLTKSNTVASYKNIGYYKGKKLKQMTLTINNNSAVDLTIELFNPSMPLDYLFSTSQNINNQIQLGSGQEASYTDMLFWMLANPTLIPNAKIIASGPSVPAQQQESMYFKNKNIAGEQYVEPMNLGQELDTMQFQAQTIDLDIMGNLGRPFIPDGMDIIRYRIFAGNSVTMAFYYKSKKIKKVLWKEARDKKTLM